MNRDVKRVIGFILYYREKVVTRACNFCVDVDDHKISERCDHCQSIIDKPYYKEEKKYFLEDWYNRDDGRHDKDFPWEQTLPQGALGLLDKAEGKVFTSDEVVDLIRRVISTILTTPTMRVEETAHKIFAEAGINLKKLDEDLKVVEVK